MKNSEETHATPQPQDLDQLFKEMMRTVESEIWGPNDIYSIADADLVPARLGEAEFREFILSALKECEHRANNATATLRDFLHKCDLQNRGFAEGNRVAFVATQIVYEICNTATVLRTCADLFPTRFGDSDFREFTRRILKTWLRLIQHLRGQIRSILSHLDTQGLLIDYVDLAEARRRGELSQ